MRVFCSAFGHETNSFSPVPTNRASYAQTVLIRPGDSRMEGPMYLMGVDTIIAKAQESGCELSLSTIAFAQPGAATVRSDYEQLRDEILEDLSSTGPHDMVFLLLHGAMMAEGYDDCEGDLLDRARTIVGPDVAIGVLLDLHCNITDLMLEGADIIVACREYPHIDFDERACELFDQIHATTRKEIVPTSAQYRIPMLAMFHTPREPMRSLVDRARAFEGTTGEGTNEVVQVTLAHGFPWSDFPDAGASVLVTTNDDPQGAASLARTLGHEFFALRDQGTEPMRSIDDTLDEAERILAAAGPGATVVVSDGSDNAGGGAASDSTFLLQACLDRGFEEVVIGLLWDPIVVQLAAAAGVGATLDLRIGGKTGPASGNPVDASVKVLNLTNGKKHQYFTPKQWVPLGDTALLEIEGVQLVVNTIRQQPMHPSAFLEAGCDPWSKRLVIVKSSQHFYGNFAPDAEAVLYCDAPGSLSTDVFARPYRRITRPIWPLDEVDLDQG